MPAYDTQRDAIEQAAVQARDKERAVYWVCRLLQECNDPRVELQARAALKQLGYSRARIARMVSLGEPGRHREE